MNSSALYDRACAYLGARGAPPEELLERVAPCMDEARSLARFRAAGRTYEAPLPFLQKEPYVSFLAGCAAYALVVMTLGGEIDRRIRALTVTDPSRAVVLDACASALVEEEGDEWEARFGAERTYRFCPGYGGSPVSDVVHIFRELRPERLGMQLLPSGLMAPQKSMAGVVGIGRRRERSCGACMLYEHCAARREGRVCYRSENK